MRISLNMEFLYPKQQDKLGLPILYVADKLPVFKNISHTKANCIRTELTEKLIPNEWVEHLKEMCIEEQQASRKRQAVLNHYRSKAQTLYPEAELTEIVKASHPELFI